MLDEMEATSGIEPEYTDLQSAASPLRHVASGAGSMPETFLMQDRAWAKHAFRQLQLKTAARFIYNRDLGIAFGR